MPSTAQVGEGLLHKVIDLLTLDVLKVWNHLLGQGKRLTGRRPNRVYSRRTYLKPSDFAFSRAGGRVHTLADPIAVDSSGSDVPMVQLPMVILSLLGQMDRT